MFLRGELGSFRKPVNLIVVLATKIELLVSASADNNNNSDSMGAVKLKFLLVGLHNHFDVFSEFREYESAALSAVVFSMAVFVRVVVLHQFISVQAPDRDVKAVHVEHVRVVVWIRS